MKYSVVVPVDLKLRPFDILKKIKSIIKRASDEVEIVFGHNDRNSLFDKYLKNLSKTKAMSNLLQGAFIQDL